MTHPAGWFHGRPLQAKVGEAKRVSGAGRARKIRATPSGEWQLSVLKNSRENSAFASTTQRHTCGFRYAEELPDGTLNNSRQLARRRRYIPDLATISARSTRPPVLDSFRSLCCSAHTCGKPHYPTPPRGGSAPRRLDCIVIATREPLGPTGTSQFQPLRGRRTISTT